MNHTPPMVHMTTALWVLVLLVPLSCLPFLLSLRRPKPKPPKPRHHVVSWRVLWWRKLAPPEAVRRELAPHEMQFSDLTRLAELFPDDAEEEDHADA